MKRKIALVYGGQSAEHKVSVSGYENVRRIIDREKYDTVDIYIDLNGVWYIDTGGVKKETFPVRLGKRSGIFVDGDVFEVDCAFPILHGDGGEDGTVQGALECAGIPYVGERIGTSVIAIDKAYTKTVARGLGIPTADWLTFRHNEDEDTASRMCESTLGFPLFLKPVCYGSSVGAHAVYVKESFAECYYDASSYGAVIAERLVSPKRELELAYLGCGGEEIITDPCEIICGGTYGYDEKYSGATRTLVRADVSENVKKDLHRYASLLARELGLRSISRIDFFLSGDEILFNEINTMPGFTGESMYLRMLNETGISSARVIDSLIERAVGGER